MFTHNQFPVRLNVDITETDLNYLIKANISGFRAESVNVTSWHDSLIIEMETMQEPGQSYYLGELEHDYYRRVIPLGFAINSHNFYTKYSSDTLKVYVKKPVNKQSNTVEDAKEEIA